MTGFDLGRLRHGETIAGVAGLVLLVVMFALPWYGLSAAVAPTAATLGAPTSMNAWDSLANIRWLLLVAALLGLGLALAQARRRAPALPATLAVLLTVIGLLATCALIYRVGLNPPGEDSLIERRVGGFIGLAATIALTVGGYRSQRQEGILERDGPGEIPTVTL